MRVRQRNGQKPEVELGNQCKILLIGKKEKKKKEVERALKVEEI